MSTHLPTGNLSTIGETRAALFVELDKRAREIEKQYKETWVELADLCVTMRDSQLWREGGFHSYNAWLLDACPTARSTAYSAVGAREELTEIPEEDLRQIPIGNAQTLKKIPKQHRGKEVIEDAKKKSPPEFEAKMAKEIPEAHIEHKVTHKLRLAPGVSAKLREALDRWRFLNQDPEAPVEDAFEGMIADYLESTQGEYEKACHAHKR